MSSARLATTTQPFVRRNTPPGGINLAANYTAVATDYGKTISNIAASSAAPVVSLDAGLPIDFELAFYCYNGGFGLQVQMPAGQFLQVGGSSTTSGGTATWAANLGGTMTIRKLAANRWGYVAGGGAAPTLA